MQLQRVQHNRTQGEAARQSPVGKRELTLHVLNRKDFEAQVVSGIQRVFQGQQVRAGRMVPSLCDLGEPSSSVPNGDARARVHKLLSEQLQEGQQRIAQVLLLWEELQTRDYEQRQTKAGHSARVEMAQLAPVQEGLQQQDQRPHLRVGLQKVHHENRALKTRGDVHCDIHAVARSPVHLDERNGRRRNHLDVGGVLHEVLEPGCQLIELLGL